MSLRTVSIVALSTLALAGCQNGRPQKDEAAAAAEAASHVVGQEFEGNASHNVNSLSHVLASGSLSALLSDTDSDDLNELAADVQSSIYEGNKTSWRSSDRKTRIKVTAMTQNSTSLAEKVTILNSVTAPESLELLNVPYWIKSKSGVRIRTAPNTDSAIQDTFVLGTTFDAIGKTSNDWVAIGRKGVLVGYIYSPLVALTPYKETENGTDLNNFAGTLESKSGSVFDFTEENTTTLPLTVTRSCAMLNYTVTSNKGNADLSDDVCQQEDGSWALK
ncbi:SH3 domain-containing protein [Pokkaliibacter sp. CJK22405]|uniref:SH3 domain-containing protein n=1 Tax=Pokkaliibacter sp. CJK22405 TaxID=3384615 RepID=UPI00398471FB